MQKNRWARKFDWVKITTLSGDTYIQQPRDELYDENKHIAVGDIYFRLNKYLTGVTFTYVNNLEDIYKKDILTGDGYSIVNMYNEYDIIDNFVNIITVDVASTDNIILKSGNTLVQWDKAPIDNIKLKPGHLVLLKNQINETENDIYKVTNNYLLENAGLLTTREDSFRLSCCVKLGTNADKQFFLSARTLEEYDFPIIFEPKRFIEGNSYIIKHLINYNLYNTSTGNTSKIIFTDYDVARKQISNNSGSYNELYVTGITNTIIPETFVTINYHDDEFSIRSGTTSGLTFSGLTSYITTNSSGTVIPYKYIPRDEAIFEKKHISGSTIYEFRIDKSQINDSFNLDLIGTGITYVSSGTSNSDVAIGLMNLISGSTLPYVDMSVRTGFLYDYYLTITGTTSGLNFISTVTSYYTDINPFFDVIVNDYLKIRMFSGDTTYLEMFSFVKSVNVDNVDSFIIEDTIPNVVLSDLDNTYYDVENLKVAVDWDCVIDKLSNKNPYMEYYSLSARTYTVGIVDFITIRIRSKEYSYNKYFDYDGLSFSFFDDIIIKNFSPLIPYRNNLYVSYKLFDRLNEIDSTGFTSGFTFFNEILLTGFTYQYIDNSKIKIITNLSGLTNIFKPYTYVYASGIGQLTQKTLVYSVNDHEIVIEKPADWSNLYPLNEFSPQIISIQNIDGLLNISNILYEVYMNKSYPKDTTIDWYIQKSDNVRKYIARAYAELLTLNEFFRNNVTGIIYENDNNEAILKLYNFETDPVLSIYSPIELIFVGSNRKTRLPVPLSLVEINNTSTTTTTV